MTTTQSRTLEDFRLHPGHVASLHCDFCGEPDYDRILAGTSTELTPMYRLPNAGITVDICAVCAGEPDGRKLLAECGIELGARGEMAAVPHAG